jgi:hypothetical protein
MVSFGQETVQFSPWQAVSTQELKSWWLLVAFGDIK